MGKLTQAKVDGKYNITYIYSTSSGRCAAFEKSINTNYKLKETWLAFGLWMLPLHNVGGRSMWREEGKLNVAGQTCLLLIHWTCLQSANEVSVVSRCDEQRNSRIKLQKKKYCNVVFSRAGYAWLPPLSFLLIWLISVNLSQSVKCCWWGNNQLQTRSQNLQKLQNKTWQDIENLYEIWNNPPWPQDMYHFWGKGKVATFNNTFFSTCCWSFFEISILRFLSSKSTFKSKGTTFRT